MSQIESNSNTSLSLTQKFTGDVGAALGAGLALAPFITPMDAAITESMSGKSTITRSLTNSFKEILTKPHRYIMRPEFGIIFGVYSATYMSKNMIDSYCNHKNMSNEQTSFWKFWGVLAVNGSLCVFWRDPQFAKIFGTKAPTAVPIVSYLLWAGRDIAHTLGAVIGPDYCEKRFNLTENQWRQCQLAFPLLVQLITTPFHLSGLDYYNFKESNFSSRISRISKAYLPSVGVRMCRMFPPWSIGLIANREIRNAIRNNML